MPGFSPSQQKHTCIDAWPKQVCFLKECRCSRKTFRRKDSLNQERDSSFRRFCSLQIAAAARSRALPPAAVPAQRMLLPTSSPVTGTVLEAGG